MLELLKQALLWLETALTDIFPRPAYEVDPASLEMNKSTPENPVNKPSDSAPIVQDSAPSPETPQLSPLEHFCLAIRDYEGKPGDLNYQNNNPGNCRCSSVGYLPKYGKVLCVKTASGMFAKFPTYQLGWEYLMALVVERIHQHPDWTILDFFKNYSPSTDNNNPARYAAYVASRIAVDVSYKIKNLIA